jgi:RNA polymerase sigma-70 factor (ECF subfamily)
VWEGSEGGLRSFLPNRGFRRPTAERFGSLVALRSFPKHSSSFSGMLQTTNTHASPQRFDQEDRTFRGTVGVGFVPIKTGAEAMTEAIDSSADPLLRRAQEGDGSALGQLLESYRAYLIVLARVQVGRRLQGKVDASDVVQEAFLGAHRDFPQFRGTTERELVGWLRGILASLLANLVRHYHGTKARDVRLERQLAVELEQSSQAMDRGLVAAQSSPSQQAARREQSVLLAEALGRLPEEWRELLILRHLEGLTFPEVAERLGRTLDSVKKQWPRALAALRRLMVGGTS